jgi:GHMP kinase-like protein
MVVAPPLMVRCRTTIPREVDLGGSSAMVTTALWGLAELHRGDRGELRRLVDQNFDARSRLYPLDPRHVRMVDVARSLGASANYTGSGGAIVAVPPDGWDLVAAGSAFRAKGCELILPIIA